MKLAWVVLLAAAVGCSGSSGSSGAAANGAPVISAIAAPPSLTRDVAARVTVWAADPDGDALTYAWTVPAGFAIVSGQGTSQLVVEATRFASGLALVTVSDGAASTTAGVYLATSDGAWGTATLVETGSGDATAPQVAMDGAGDAIAVWPQSDGTRYNLWANRYVAGVGWGTATLIETDNTGSATNPAVAMSAVGDAVAVWQQFDGTRYNIWANRYVTGVGWGTAALIETNDAGSAVSPQVAMDLAGNAIAVWQQSDGTRDNIWANRYVAGGGWGTAALLETGSGTVSSAAVAMDAAGDAIAVWTQSDGTRDNVWANRYVAGGGWGTAALIETDDAGGASAAQIAMDPAGDAIAVWYQFDGSHYNICANRYAAGAGWGTATLVETDNAGHAYSPQVAMDAAGNAIAVWYQSDGFRANVSANRYVAGAGWGTATLIETGNAGDAISPAVAVGATGDAVAVWTQSDGTRYNICANRFQ